MVTRETHGQKEWQRRVIKINLKSDSLGKIEREITSDEVEWWDKVTRESYKGK